MKSSGLNFCGMPWNERVNSFFHFAGGLVGEGHG